MSFARVRALVVIGILVVAAAVFVVVALVKDRQSGPQSAEKCAEGAVVVNAKLPTPEEVKLNIYNATSKPGLAGNVSQDFLARKFKEAKVQTAQPSPAVNKPTDQVAYIRFGPKAVGASWLVRAYFLNQARYEFDKARQDDWVDVIIGGRFQQLPTTTEVNQAIGALGNPTLPEGTCAADG
ncbi:hypothetical protein GCM10010399_40860 [Dactylosporangium fulvum]|uniref:LytR C-terminal domain-containing protein n=1 Tax=Dactylosporangium fulvum TaxID=53359 RepID=A0ABY5W4J4_9ACTN|nr:LytR C-terminal domain-containing protein [Dactylosporangium fulvum]UWP84290.1 LytR C-terminal domain-containing protein [Dactylosporangium fulvum]